MSAAAVQTRSAQSNTTSVSVSITTTAANLLGIVTIGGGTGATVNAPTRTGETNDNAVAQFGDTTNYDFLRGDYMMNIGGNSNTVGGSISTGGVSVCVTEYSGAKTTAAGGATNTNSQSQAGATTIQTNSVTPTAGSALMTGVTGSWGTNTAATIDSGFTVDETGGAATVWDGSGTVAGGGSAHHDNVSAVATNPTWTMPSGGAVTNRAALIMEFLSAAIAPVARLEEAMQNTQGLVVLTAVRQAVPW